MLSEPISIFIVLSVAMWTWLFLRGCKNTFRGNGSAIGILWLFLFGIVVALGWMIIFEVIK
jgi:CHASE1-domain containing sensor protein